MNSAMSKYLEAASGLTQLTKARAEGIVKQLVKQGETATESAGELVEDLLDRSKRNREQITALVKSETARAVKRMGLATQDEVARLQDEVRDLDRKLAAAGTSATSQTSTAKKATAKKATAKETAAKKTAKKATPKKTAKKATPKKATAKKTTAKKTAAKKTAKKASSKKASTKKSSS